MAKFTAAQPLLDQHSFTQALSVFHASLLTAGGGTLLAIKYCEITVNRRRER